jgi:multicomponent Na+:H+ antiporter subunit D
MGAVLMRTGTCKGTELGGLYKSMPWTTLFCCIGAASISAFPLFSGFVSKALILTAALEEQHTVVWLVLLFASAGVFHHSGIKIPFFAFFAHDSKKRVDEAPPNMLAAMALTSALCIGIGCAPGLLYRILPFPVDYEPYTTTHVITQYQLLIFSALAFTVLKRTGIYPPELRATNLDTDWFYRRAGKDLVVSIGSALWRLRAIVVGAGLRLVARFVDDVRRLHGPGGIFARTWSTGSIALWATLGLAGYLLLYFLER